MAEGGNIDDGDKECGLLTVPVAGIRARVVGHLQVVSRPNRACQRAFPNGGVVRW